MMQWIKVDNSSWPYYETFYVWDHFRANKFIQPSTCAEFAWRFLNELVSQNVSLNLYQHPRHDFMNVYSKTAPVAVNETDSATWDAIVDWYSLFRFESDNPFEIVKQLKEILKSPRKFIFAYNVYYEFDAASPYLNFCYGEDPFKGVPYDIVHPDRCFPKSGVPSSMVYF